MTPLILTNFLRPHRNFDPSLGEIMDRSQPVSDDLKIALDNMEKLNRFFGGYNLIRHFYGDGLLPVSRCHCWICAPAQATFRGTPIGREPRSRL